MNTKIQSQKNILTIARRLKKKRKKIVLLSGSFDILHRGHINCLSKAKERGDVLILLLNNDRSVRKYKGTSRPIMGEKDRALILSALACVDYIVLFSGISPIALAKRIQPDVYCNGLAWERNIMKKYSGRMYVIPRTKGISSTDVIKKCRA